MSVTGPNTGFKIVNADGGPYTQDLGKRYVSKDYLLDVYPNLVPGRTTPGLWVWGTGGFTILGVDVYGMLGDGTIVSKSSPVQIGTLTNWKQVDAGDYHSLSVKTDGTLWAWGYNGTGGAALFSFGPGGALGDGTIVSKSSPVQIGALTNWKQVSGGLGISAAVKTDGTLWTWGSGDNGKLGRTSTTSFSSPVQVGALTNWKQISAGGFHMAAVKRDGTLWTWGLNTNGQLGDGTIVVKSSPVQIGTLTNWKQVSAGVNYTAAVKTDGTIWAWGRNNDGQLGDSTTVDKSSPIQIGSLTNWKQVAAGAGDASRVHTAAIKTDGTLWAWGDNAEGQLGNISTTNRSSPIQIGTLTNWKQVAAGFNSTASIKTDGTLWTWGNGGSGKLGNGTVVAKSSPVQVGTLTNWKEVSIGYSHNLSILDGYI